MNTRERLVAGMALVLALPAAASGAPSDPDLRVSAFTNSASQAAIGSERTLSATIRNSGRRRAKTTRVAFYLSLDAGRNTGDIPLTPRAPLRALARGGSASVQVRVRIPTKASLRSYMLLVCSDDTRLVRERSERNNCRAAKRRIRIVAAEQAPSPPPSPHWPESPPPPPGPPPQPPPPPGPPTAPQLSTTASALGYTENDPATAIDHGLTLVDPDSPITGATVKLTAGYQQGWEVLALSAPPGGIVPNWNPWTGELTLSGTASVIDYRAALRSVTYRNTSDAPATITRSVTFVASDGTATGSATRNITMTPTNDAPIAVADYAGTDENTMLIVGLLPGLLINDTDPDPGDTKAIVGLNGSPTLTGTSVNGAPVTLFANGRIEYDPRPVAAFDALNTGQEATDTFTYTMADAAAEQSTATVTVRINGVTD